MHEVRLGDRNPESRGVGRGQGVWWLLGILAGAPASLKNGARAGWQMMSQGLHGGGGGGGETTLGRGYLSNACLLSHSSLRAQGLGPKRKSWQPAAAMRCHHTDRHCT